MEVTKYNEVVDYDIFETTTHRFKIKSDKLKALKEHINYPTNILKLVQKSMKQIVDNCSGEMWQESVTSIYEAITRG